MTEKEISRQFKEQAVELFPSLKSVHIRQFSAADRCPYDFEVELIIGRRRLTKRIICEVKAQATPKVVRETISRWNAEKCHTPHRHFALIAPYVSEASRQLCKQGQIGFFDLAGNCFLDLDNVFLEISGRPSRSKVAQPLKSLFHAKSERVLRVLLVEHEREWGTRELASAAKVSPGLVTKVITKLDDQALIFRGAKGRVRLEKPGQLLDEWRLRYSYQRNRVLSFYSLRSPAQIEVNIANYSQEHQLEYALALFSAANYLAPFTRYSQAAFYCSSDLADLQKTLDLKPVESGANVLVLVPYDEGVYFYNRTVEGKRIVHPIQTYLDLYNFRGRGREQAEFIREQLMSY